MISKNQIKAIRQLENKKHRMAERRFVAEGPKVVCDMLEAFEADCVVATEEWLSLNDVPPGVQTVCVGEEELKKVSFLQHPQHVLAVLRLPCDGLPDSDLMARASSQLCLALDGVRDPGNMGTIIRVADWFGIETIFCSHDSADVFAPKVVQASMGSLARVKVVETDLCALLDAWQGQEPVYGTSLDGDDIYQADLSAHGVIVMGNEGRGISDDVARRVTRRLLIPNFPPGRSTADSLNVAVATAVACAEFRRRAR